MRPKPAAPATPAFAVARLRLACVAAGITLLVFSQSSGKEAPDTKLDLVVAPWRFLTAALHMWDARAGAGQMQDQAYGYLFPMGPFFLLGKLAALPPWIVQRSWESLLLVAAFLGVVRLARLLGVRGFWPRVGAGLAYALAPRMLMEIPVISSELLPVVVLPWVLIPLVRGASGGSPRRAAARSGLALLFAGGINASATLAILPVPALWLLTRSAGPRRRALMSWWALAVLAACLWWLVPLLVLGRYSPPFLDWIESSAVTTGPTSLLATLRGADHWQAYLGPSVWPGGWILVAAPAAVLATTAVAALGLAGLARRRIPHRVFLVCCLLLGLALVTLGHVATVGPPFAHSVRLLLDGPLNAFRNVHKFDPVLRLPIALGVGHGLVALHERWPAQLSLRLRGTSVPTHGRSILVLAMVGVAAVAISPALLGRLVPGTRTINDPGWWAQTGAWLGSHDGRALVVPGAPAPVYVWGSPRDDALQPYAQGPWTVRDVAPLTQPGYVRLLDEVETELASGVDEPVLAPLLARAGIRYLVVRNDLETSRSGATPLRFVHATIAASPGWHRVASFGPSQVGGPDPQRLVDYGITTSRSAVDVYENAAWTDDVTLLPDSGAIVANGSSDQLAPLVAAGLPDTTPVIFGRRPAALAAAGIPSRTVATDGIRRREFGFGGISAYSATLPAHQGFSTPRAAHDYLPDSSGPLTTAAFSGIAGVRASSSASDPTSLLYRGPAFSPWAALDGDPKTAWFSAALGGAVGQWFEVDLSAPVTTRTVRLTFAPGQDAYPTRLRVTTDTGSIVTDVSPDGTPQEVAVPATSMQSIRFTVLSTSSPGYRGPVGIAGLTIAGVHPSRTLRVATSGTPDAFVFRVAGGQRPACLSVAAAPACDASWALPGEEDDLLSRTFSVTSSAAYSFSATVHFAAGRSTDALLDGANPIRATASSVQADDPRERPGAVIDGDPDTGWMAAPGDKAPTIRLTWPTPGTIDGLVLAPFADAPAGKPTRVSIRAGSTRFEAAVPNTGRIEFPAPVRSSSVTITVLKSSLRVSTDSLTGEAQLLPVGIGEITLLGAGLPAPQVPATVTLGCAAGLSATVDGTTVPLQVEAGAGDVLAGREVTATPCLDAPVRLDGGSHEVALPAAAGTAPESVTLTRTGGAAALTSAAPSPGTSSVRSWGSTRRTVQVATGSAAFLLVRENANVGWRATLHGRTLPPVTLDGWEQGWLLPAGARGTVVLTFTPQGFADWGLLAGLIAAVGLLAAAWFRGRSTGPAPLHDARWPFRAVVLVGVGALGLLGGVGGLAAGVIVVGALFVARRRGVRVPIWAGGAVLMVGGLAEAWRPAGSADPAAGSAGVQLMCLVALALCLASPFAATAPRPGEPAQQWPLVQMPRRRRDRRRRHRGENEEPDEVTLEAAPAHHALDRDQ